MPKLLKFHKKQKLFYFNKVLEFLTVNQAPLT
jgi:hypothetical protein